MRAQERARLAVSLSRWAARPARRILGLGAPGSSEAQPQPCAHPSDTSCENGEHAAAVSSRHTPLKDSSRKFRQPKHGAKRDLRFAHAWHTPPQRQPQPQDSSTRTRAALRAPRAAPARLAPPQVAAPPISRNHARTTTHDDEKMLSAHKGTKPETPIDGVRQKWAAAPATRSPPSSSHASVAHTATRLSSQGPTSALRFNYFPV